MITRLESCTKRAPRDELPPRVPARLVWDIALVVCALTYLALVLFADVESPVLSMAFIALAAYELVQPHLRHH